MREHGAAPPVDACSLPSVAVPRAWPRIAVCLLSLVLLRGVARADETYVSGPISGQVAWSGVVHVTGDVTIPAGAKLSIAPGTKVLIEPNGDDTIGGENPSRVEIILDSGELVAQGTEADPVVFTSAADKPQAGDWAGIFVKGDRLSLSWCKVEFPIEGLNVVSGSPGAPDAPVVNHCVFQSCKSAGAMLRSSYALADCTFQGCATGVITTGQAPTLTLTRCKVLDSLADGLNCPAPTKVTLNGCTVTGSARYGVISQASFTADGTEISGSGTAGVTGNSVSLTNCTVNQNGAFGVQGRTVEMQGCTLDANKGAAVIAQGAGVFDHCIVTNNGADALQVTASIAPWASITACTLVGNKASGLLLSGWGDKATITGSLIRANRWGLDLNANSSDGSPKISLDLSGCDIFGNDEFDVRNRSARAVAIAKENYWGDLTTSELQAHKSNLTKVSDSRDTPSSGQVVIQAFSVTPLTQLGPTPSLPPLAGANLAIQDLRARPGTTRTVTVAANGAIRLATQAVFTLAFAESNPAGAPALAVDSAKVAAGTVLPQGVAVVTNNATGSLVVQVASQTAGSGPGALATIPISVPAAVPDGTKYTLELRDASVTIDGKQYSVTGDKRTLKVSSLKRGDANKDGNVTINDAVQAIRFVAGLAGPDEDQLFAADADASGSLDIRDVLAILKALLGLTKLPDD